MTKFLMSGVAAIAIGAAALPVQAQDSTKSAAAECTQKLDKLRTSLSGDKRFSQTYRSGAVNVGDYELLRRAAITFARNGMEGRCDDVVEGMRELAKRQSDAFDKRDRTAEDDADRTTREEQRLAELKAASPINDASVSIETIMGKDVRNLKDEDLGDVEDVVMNKGAVEKVIVARGGFLGLGVTYYQVAWTDLKITKDNETVVLDISEEKIESMPKVEKQDGRWVADNTDPADAKNDRVRNKDADKTPAEKKAD